MHAPLVTNIDRQWALDQCPPWASRDAIVDRLPEPAGETSDALLPPSRAVERLNWDLFVAGQVERFERFYGHERKTYDDWSALWRKSWWPRAKNSGTFTKYLPPSEIGVWPTFRHPSAEFECAIAIGNPVEQKVWSHVGVITLRPDDVRVARIRQMAQERGARRSDHSQQALAGGGR